MHQVPVLFYAIEYESMTAPFSEQFMPLLEPAVPHYDTLHWLLMMLQGLLHVTEMQVVAFLSYKYFQVLWIRL